MENRILCGPRRKEKEKGLGEERQNRRKSGRNEELEYSLSHNYHWEGKEKGEKKESKEEMKERGREDENPLIEVVTAVTD